MKQVFRSFARNMGSFFRFVYYGHRYLLLTPAGQSKQLLYDRKRAKLVRLEIRDQIDFGTLHEIYLAECYSLDLLARYSELCAHYQAVVDAGKTPLILDCGGNIGLAAKYFSENFDAARILCIEPEAKNIDLARKNNPSGNVELLHNAVGSEAGWGTIIDPGLGNNAFRIDTAHQGTTKIVSINELIAQYDDSAYSPFIAKIDIEGFEDELFSRNTEWIEKFPLLIIELHDWMLPKSKSASNFLRAIAPLDRDFILRGENVFSIRNTFL
jgi:FkbM family methyltransferase